MIPGPVVIGVDVGGSHITAAALHASTHAVIDSTRFESDYDGSQSKDKIFEDWASVINMTLSKIHVQYLKGLAFAVPGAFEYSKGIAKYHGVGKLDSLFNAHIPSELKPYLKIENGLEFRFINDASAFAMGEAIFGSARGTKKSVSITLGTGFGSAFINNGIPVITGSSVPPEGCLWHLPFKNGIADDYISTRWFEKQMEERFNFNVIGVRLISAMARKDGIYLSLFEEFGENLATILIPWLMRFEAEVLVIGGQMVGAYDLFGPTLEVAMTKAGLSTTIRKSSLMVNGAIMGSSLLFSDILWHKLKDKLPSI